ncbi:MAG: hypothetical protein ABIM99_01245 [Candidatus Dojkabacteria bacterium]
MKTIKELSGEILLYFYAKQREQGFSYDEIIRFEGIYTGKISYNGPEELNKISNNNSADIYNAMNYLNEKSFLSFKSSSDSGGDSIHSLKVSASGVDIIEGIERDNQARNDFTVNFNIKLAETMNVESLLKAELGSLLKFGLVNG